MPGFWWGYCPLYRHLDHRPILVGLREHMGEPLSKIPRCAQVLVARRAGKFNGVTVTRHGEEMYVTARPDRQGEPDLMPFLLRMWAIPGLESWVSKNLGGHRDGDSCEPAGGRAADLGGAGGAVADVRLESSEDDPRWLRAAAESRRNRAGRLGRNGPPTLGESLNGFHPGQHE
jgi:hypothetical protein